MAKLKDVSTSRDRRHVTARFARAAAIAALGTMAIGLGSPVLAKTPMSASRPATAGALRAGAARVDITPPPSMMPAKGLGLFVNVHDPLFVRALALDTGKDKALLISIDAIILVDTDGLLNTLAQELKIPRDHIFMNATHDHNTPVMAGTSVPGTYGSVVAKGVTEAARQALARLQPARIGYRTGKAYINANRDEKIGDHYTMGYAPEGPSDKTVAALTITNLAGKPIAVYANYAVHGVVMFFSKTRDGQQEITGDLPGATARYVEEKLGGDVIALWTPGAAGDQNPQYTSVVVTDKGFKDSGAGGWTLMDSQARRLGDEIVRIANDTTDTADSVGIAVRKTSLTCPAQKAPKPDAPEPAPVNIPLTLMTIGNVALAGVGGELFSEIGQAVKAKSLFHDTMVVTLLPDGVGYIPSERAYTLPSEKAVSAAMKPGCAETGIPAAFNKMAADMLAEKNGGK